MFATYLSLAARVAFSRLPNVAFALSLAVAALPGAAQTPSSSGLTVALNHNPANVGQSVTITADVVSAEPVVTGTVTFFDNGAPLCINVPLPPQQRAATCAFAPATQGVHVLTASYSGDGRNRAAGSFEDLRLFVNVAGAIASSVALSVSADQDSVGADDVVGLVATVSGTMPTGEVSFYAARSPVYSPLTPVAGCQRIRIFSPTTGRTHCLFRPGVAGTYFIAAEYSGDAKNAASVSPRFTQEILPVVTLPAATVEMSSSANPVAAGQPFRLSAVVKSAGLPAPSSLVYFYEIVVIQGVRTFGGHGGYVGTCQLVTVPAGSTAAGTNTASASGGEARCVSEPLTLPEGVHEFFASYNGDAAHGGSISASPGVFFRQTVNAAVVAMPALTLSSTANPVAYRRSISAIASVGDSTAGGSVTFRVSDGVAQAVFCDAIPVVGGTAVCPLPARLMVIDSLTIQASYSGDAIRSPAEASLVQRVTMGAVTLTANAQPLPLAAGTPATLQAMVTGLGIGGHRVSFFDEGGSVLLPGCAGLPVALLPGAVDTGVVSCPFTPTAGQHAFVVILYPPAPAANFIDVAPLQLNVAPATGPDYGDVWWPGPTENGWGLSVTQHGNGQFIVLYVYDDNGKPVWYALPSGVWNATHTAFGGALYRPHAAPYFAYDFNRFEPGDAVGTASITYTGSNAATLSYTINGRSGSKQILRQPFAINDGKPVLQVGDLWYAPAEIGWGLNLGQQGRGLFPVWYTYGADGAASWFAVPGGDWSGSSFSGDLYRTTSSAWLGVPYQRSAFVPIKVGTMRLDFSDQRNAVMTFTVDGVTQTKRIERQPF